MGNQFNTVSTGQLFLPSAAKWNRMQVAARQAEQAKLDAGPKTAKLDLPPAGYVLVKNITGSPISQFGVLKLSGPLITPANGLEEFRSRVVMTGVTPDGDTGSKFCVLAEPLGPGRIGRAFVSGIIPVKVDVTDEADEYANPTATTETLKSAGEGSARIIWKEDGEGIVWALVEKAIATSSDADDGTPLTCCCEESRCLKSPSDPQSIIYPETYRFRMPAFRCNCVPAEDAGAYVNLELVDAVNRLVWESAKIQCYGGKFATLPCTQTTNWIWVLDPCSGGCSYESTEVSPGVWEWVLTDNNCGPSCPDCESPVGMAGPGAGTQDTDCTNGGGPSTSGHWGFVSNDDPDCNCTAEEPDYEPVWDGTGDAPTATTTCDATTIGDGTGVLLDAFWRLTIVPTRNYYGCDETKLEFIIGQDVVLTYYLQTGCDPHRGFCRQCVNTFKLAVCGPTQCDVEPMTIICLEPMTPGAVPCSHLPCDYPIALRLPDWALSASGEFYLTTPDLPAATLRAAWNGDKLLYNTSALPCVWRYTFPRLFCGPGEVGACGLDTVTADRYLVGEIVVTLSPKPTGPGYFWSIHLGIGYEDVATEDFPPCYETGEVVQFGTLIGGAFDPIDGYASDGLTDEDPTDDVVFQETLSCDDPLDIPTWDGVELTQVLEILDGSLL